MPQPKYQERKAEWLTEVVAKNDVCPICREPLLFGFREQKLSPYGRHGVSYRELVEDPAAYRGRITLCHLACWDGLPEIERQRLNERDALESEPRGAAGGYET